MRDYLTSPCEPSTTKPHDNVKDDLIVARGDIISKSETQRFIITAKLGSGTFGQVFRCTRNGEEFAIKVIKNDSAYFNHGYSEVRLLRKLKSAPSILHLFSEYFDDFVYRNHLCIVMELLGKSLYDVLKMGGFSGLLDHAVLKRVVFQIVEGLGILNRMGIIHCDLKPENILVCDPANVKIKIVDFGNALFNSKGDNFYVQSRYYRAPEVILGFSYDFSVDVWSLGCIIYELFMGTPLFPGKDSNEMINRIVYLLGDPPNFMVEYGCNSSKYFVKERVWNEMRDEGVKNKISMYETNERFDYNGKYQSIRYKENHGNFNREDRSYRMNDDYYERPLYDTFKYDRNMNNSFSDNTRRSFSKNKDALQKGYNEETDRNKKCSENSNSYRISIKYQHKNFDLKEETENISNLSTLKNDTHSNNYQNPFHNRFHYEKSTQREEKENPYEYTIKEEFVLRNIKHKPDFISKKALIEKVFLKTNNVDDNNKLCNLLFYILKINHLERPMALQIINHPYFCETELNNVALEMGQKTGKTVERNQPNPPPKERFSRRYSIHDSSTFDKTGEDFGTKRKQSVYEIKKTKDGYPFDENKRNG